MAVQYDSTPRAVADGSNIVMTLGVGSLGGTIGVRVIVDDAVLTTREQALLALEQIGEAVTRRNWPAT